MALTTGMPSMSLFRLVTFTTRLTTTASELLNRAPKPLSVEIATTIQSYQRCYCVIILFNCSRYVLYCFTHSVWYARSSAPCSKYMDKSSMYTTTPETCLLCGTDACAFLANKAVSWISMTKSASNEKVWLVFVVFHDLMGAVARTHPPLQLVHIECTIAVSRAHSFFFIGCPYMGARSSRHV